MRNAYGSVYLPSGVSGVPKGMLNNGWSPYNHSNSKKEVWQYRKKLPNGRHHEIRFDEHDRKERAHIHIKYMLLPNEKPTKKQFFVEVGPEIKKKMNNILKKKSKRSHAHKG